jgi:hypothetical protein
MSPQPIVRASGDAPQAQSEEENGKPPFPNRSSFTGEDNRRKELPANHCPLQLAEPGAADSLNRKGENDE